MIISLIFHIGSIVVNKTIFIFIEYVNTNNKYKWSKNNLKNLKGIFKKQKRNSYYLNIAGILYFDVYPN